MSDATDPKGLIREAYRIEGITDGECRSIFLDWAISRPTDSVVEADVQGLLDRYAAAAPDHPMTAVLREGLAEAPTRQRRGGWRGRRGGQASD